MPGPDRSRPAFEETALRHLDTVYRYALYLTGNQPDAEDLTQDAFLLAYRGFGQLRQGTDARAWLFRIARNAHIDRVRRKARAPVAADLSEVATDFGNPEKALETGFDRGRSLAIDSEEVFLDLFGDEVKRYLEELPAEFRAALLLCDVEGMSYREIGEALECPVGTVRSRIFRAREHLRGKLYEYARGLGFVQPSAK